MIYTIGSVAVSGNTLTGTGTNFKAPLSMIRVGCTVIVKSDPIQIFSITEIVSDTELSVTPAASPDIPAGTAYSILLCDSISVDGLAQDVAEALRYFTGQESEIASAIEILNSFSGDIELESLLNALQNIQEETAKSTANAQQTEANKEMTGAAAIRAEEAATSASGSATSASTSASTATTKASEASTSATNAAASAKSASDSASAAALSEGAASDSADAASSSASSAATSASTASTKASEASASATNAAKSASNAAGSASAASTSATNAASSAAEAKNYLDQMTDVTIDLSKVSGVLDVAHGGTGQNTENGLKSYLEGLGFSTSSGTSIALPLSIAQGGTGAATASAAWAALGGGSLGKLNALSLSGTQITGTLSISNGGTGATTANAAWTALGGGFIGKLNTVSLTTNVSGTLPVVNGGTGVTSLDELKTALGITDSGTGGAGTSSNDYDLTETSFNFQNPTTGRLFVSYNNMTNFPKDSMLSAVVYVGSSEEYIDSVSTSDAKCIIECTKVTDSAGNVAYSMVVTRCVPSLTPKESNIARCYGYGKVSGTAISWAFRQDFW